uniref:PNO1 second type I KH domain-containing protein n=1 Tax=Solanum lycopersicum TaxID=4081 RepID=A0A3Q7IEC7_SOLLC
MSLNLCYYLSFDVLILNISRYMWSRFDELYVDSFKIKDVNMLRGEHLSRAIGRLSTEGKKPKFATKNVAKIRILISD